MRFSAYILVVMLFFGFVVGEAAAYLTVYHSTQVRGGQTINVPGWWTGAPASWPDAYNQWC